MCVKIQHRTIAFAFCFQLWHGDCGLKKRRSNPFGSLYLILFQLLDCVSFWQHVFSGLKPISGGLNLLTWLLAHVCLCNSHHSKPIVLRDKHFSFFRTNEDLLGGVNSNEGFLQVTLQYYLSVFINVY